MRESRICFYNSYRFKRRYCCSWNENASKFLYVPNVLDKNSKSLLSIPLTRYTTIRRYLRKFQLYRYNSNFAPSKNIEKSDYLVFYLTGAQIILYIQWRTQTFSIGESLIKYF